VKAFGVTFLALPRGRGAAEAVEVGWPERAAMTTLALACVVLGLGAGPVSAQLGALVSPSAPAPRWELTGAGAVAGHLSLPVVAASLVLLGLAVVAGARLFGPVRSRLAETWACGIALQPVHQYTSTAFAKPIRLMFSGIVRPVREIEIVHRAGTRAVETVHYRAHIAPIYERYIYRAVTDRLVVISHVVRRAQNGSLQLYLAYLVGALLLGLVLAR
jgi:hydrogenase-4 component B